jgi:hypothetical protein
LIENEEYDEQVEIILLEVHEQIEIHFLIHQRILDEYEVQQLEVLVDDELDVDLMVQYEVDDLDDLDE